MEQTERVRKKIDRSILKNKIPPPRTAYVLSSLPCVSAAPTPALAFGTSIRKRAPHSRASGSPAVASESGEMRCASTPPLRRGSVRRAHDTLPLPPLLTATDAPPTRAQSPAVTSARAVFSNQAHARILDLPKNYNSHKTATSRVVSMELTLQQRAWLLPGSGMCCMFI